MTLNIMIYVLIFTAGFLGGFSCLEKILNSYLDLVQMSKWINGKLVVYIMISFYSVTAFWPFLKDGMKTLNKGDINEIISVLMVVGILGVAVKASLGGAEINHELTGITDNEIKFGLGVKFLIFSPVIEELYCRCGLMFLLKKCLSVNNVMCMVISGSVFSVLHYKSLIGSNLNCIICYLLIYFILGIGCAYLYLHTDNITTSISLHMIWNGCMVGGVFVNKIISCLFNLM